MDDRNNTIAGWVLAGGIAALGLAILSSMYFHADDPHRPETMGYPIEGVEVEEGGDSGPAFATLLQSADISQGETQFAKCMACHTITPGGANGVGPNIYGVMGKQHGHIAGFAYSEALASMPGTWDWEAMNQWIAGPSRYAPGTKMTFAGISNDQDRANLIAYINSQGSNLPLPEPPAPEEPVAEASEDMGAPAADGQTSPTEDISGPEAADATAG